MINGYTESEICSLYRQAKNKKSQIEILTQLTGVNKLAIENILKKGGYLMAEKKPKIMKDIVIPNSEKIKELHAQGLTQKEIAKEVGVAQSTVHYYFKKLELEPNYRYPYKKKEGKQVKKQASYDVVEKLKEETKKNVEELKEVLPKPIPDQEDMPIDYDIVEELSPQQYYELAKVTLELLKTIWEG